MILELIEAGALVGLYIYHRLTDPGPSKPRGEGLKLPRIDDGAPYPLIYGRCRVRSPILVWVGSSGNNADVTYGNVVYFTRAMYVAGIGFQDGTNTLIGMFAADDEIPVPFGFDALSTLTGDGGHESGGTKGWVNTGIILDNGDVGSNVHGYIEFLNGKATQQLVDPTTPWSATTSAGTEMIASGVDPSLIPGYRGYISILLGAAGAAWQIGNSPQIQAYSFEVASYASAFLDRASVDLEANPADVIRDLLVGTFGKLGLDVLMIDYDSFFAAATTLREEGHGYSRAIEESTSAGDIIIEILKQIDAVLFEDPTTGTIKLKLIRADYVPADCLEVNPENCKSLETPAAGGWTGRVNKVRVVFTDRSKQYADGSATAQNQANAVGQNGLVEELVLQFPGVCTQALADDIAGRELAALSRPIFKCSAIVDRSFLRINPGDVVALTWPDWHISGMLMRVAGVTRGSLQDGVIRLDLIQDLFYTRRSVFVDGGSHGTIGSFPGTALIG